MTTAAHPLPTSPVQEQAHQEQQPPNGGLMSFPSLPSLSSTVRSASTLESVSSMQQLQGAHTNTESGRRQQQQPQHRKSNPRFSTITTTTTANDISSGSRMAGFDSSEPESTYTGDEQESMLSSSMVSALQTRPALKPVRSHSTLSEVDFDSDIMQEDFVSPIRARFSGVLLPNDATAAKPLSSTHQQQRQHGSVPALTGVRHYHSAAASGPSPAVWGRRPSAVLADLTKSTAARKTPFSPPLASLPSVSGDDDQVEHDASSESMSNADEEEEVEQEEDTDAPAALVLAAQEKLLDHLEIAIPAAATVALTASADVNMTTSAASIVAGETSHDEIEGLVAAPEPGGDGDSSGIVEGASDAARSQLSDISAIATTNSSYEDGMSDPEVEPEVLPSRSETSSHSDNGSSKSISAKISLPPTAHVTPPKPTDDDTTSIVLDPTAESRTDDERRRAADHTSEVESEEGDYSAVNYAPFATADASDSEADASDYSDEEEENDAAEKDRQPPAAAAAAEEQEEDDDSDASDDSYAPMPSHASSHRSGGGLLDDMLNNLTGKGFAERWTVSQKINYFEGQGGDIELDARSAVAAAAATATTAVVMTAAIVGAPAKQEQQQEHEAKDIMLMPLAKRGSMADSLHASHDMDEPLASPVATAAEGQVYSPRLDRDLPKTPSIAWHTSSAPVTERAPVTPSSSGSVLVIHPMVDSSHNPETTNEIGDDTDVISLAHTSAAIVSPPPRFHVPSPPKRGPMTRASQLMAEEMLASPTRAPSVMTFSSAESDGTAFNAESAIDRMGLTFANSSVESLALVVPENETELAELNNTISQVESEVQELERAIAATNTNKTRGTVFNLLEGPMSPVSPVHANAASASASAATSDGQDAVEIITVASPSANDTDADVIDIFANALTDSAPTTPITPVTQSLMNSSKYHPSLNALNQRPARPRSRPSSRLFLAPPVLLPRQSTPVLGVTQRASTNSVGSNSSGSARNSSGSGTLTQHHIQTMLMRNALLNVMPRDELQSLLITKRSLLKKMSEVSIKAQVELQTSTVSSHRRRSSVMHIDDILGTDKPAMPPANELTKALNDLSRLENTVQGKKMFNVSPEHGLRFLADCRLLPALDPKKMNNPTYRTECANAVARFLLEEGRKGGLNKAVVGRYLSESDSFHTLVLHSYIQAFTFETMTLEASLRTVLLNIQLPKMAHAVATIIEVFARHWWTERERSLSNSETPMARDDTVDIWSRESSRLISFALLQLNTDLHDERHRRKIKRKEFCRSVTYSVMTRTGMIQPTTAPGSSTATLELATPETQAFEQVLNAALTDMYENVARVPLTQDDQDNQFFWLYKYYQRMDEEIVNRRRQVQQLSRRSLRKQTSKESVVSALPLPPMPAAAEATSSAQSPTPTTAVVAETNTVQQQRSSPVPAPAELPSIDAQNGRRTTPSIPVQPATPLDKDERKLPNIAKNKKNKKGNALATIKTKLDVMTVSFGDDPDLNSDIKKRNMVFSVSNGATSADTTKHLQFVFASWSYYSKTLDFNCTPAVKRFRLKLYIHTQMATDKVCQWIIDKSSLTEQQARDNLVVCFGDASFDHASKGHAASPLQKALQGSARKGARHHSPQDHRVQPRKSATPAGSRDLLTNSITTPLAKPHFIRRCANIPCLII
ncbi:G-box binding factor [Sorochytrium milnesiophthora]